MRKIYSYLINIFSGCFPFEFLDERGGEGGVKIPQRIKIQKIENKLRERGKNSIIKNKFGDLESFSFMKWVSTTYLGIEISGNWNL